MQHVNGWLNLLAHDFRVFDIDTFELWSIDVKIPMLFSHSWVLQQYYTCCFNLLFLFPPFIPHIRTYLVTFCLTDISNCRTVPQSDGEKNSKSTKKTLLESLIDSTWLKLDSKYRATNFRLLILKYNIGLSL